MIPTPSPDLKILEKRIYRGPNYWSYGPAIRLLVDLGALENFPSDTIPGFNDGLVALLPGLKEHSCSLGYEGGFLERLNDGTWLGHVSEHVALQLQRETGSDLRRGKTRSAGEPGRYHVIYGYADETVGMAAGELAVRLVNHLVAPDLEFEFESEVERLILLAESAAFGPSTQAIIDEASLRDIPYMRLNSQSFVQLGQGVFQQRIRATMTSKTPSLAVDVAADKELTNRLLAAAGLPVPKSEAVRTAEGAVALAERFGYPVVVKPLDGNHGRGVGLDLQSEEQVRTAFEVAKSEARGPWVVVESHLIGNDYRFLVVGGKMVACAERVPAHVIGNGAKTISELVEITNADPRRGVGHEKVLTRIKIDEAAIALVKAQGYEMDDVPPKDQMVKLTLTGNMSTGGISIDRTDEAHPDNVDIAEEAAGVVGLDVAGIDFMAPDISQAVRETGGGIVEVNAAPGFRMHTNPTIGDSQYVAKPVVDLIFPPGSPSRIPIVAVTGTNGKTTTCRMIAHIFKGMGRKVGMTSTDGIVIDERLLISADASGPRSARMVLQNPRVDFAVFEVARGGILREGLGYERNDVGVVLNVAADHLGMGGIETIEQLAAVKQVVIEAVPRDGFGVLNADDPLVANMRRRCSGQLVLFSMRSDNELVEKHCRRGGRAVVLEPGNLGEMIVIRHGAKKMPLAWTHLLPATFEGKARMNVQNAIAAAAAAHAAGAHLHDIRQGLRTFTTSYYLAPGRLNLIDVGGVRVVVDYCHNSAGMHALGDFVDQFSEAPEAMSVIRHRRIGVVATAGDRRDEDMIELGEAAARYFDIILIREDVRLRGRPSGESAELIAKGIEKARVAGARCRETIVVLDELDAVRDAIGRANPGDLVVLCADRTAEVWAQLQELRARGSATQPPQAAEPEARKTSERIVADPDVAGFTPST